MYPRPVSFHLSTLPADLEHRLRHLVDAGETSMTRVLKNSAFAAALLMGSTLALSFAFADESPKFATDRLSSAQSIINYSSDLECAQSYETGWNKCMLRLPSRRAIQTKVNLRVDSLSSTPQDICLNILNQTQAMIEERLMRIGQTSDSIRASMIDYSFRGSKNRPTQIECEMRFVSRKKELRFQAHYLNGSVNLSESKKPEACDSTLVQFKKIHPNAIAAQAAVVELNADIGPAYCLATGFTIGLDQIVDGELVKFGSTR